MWMGVPLEPGIINYINLGKGIMNHSKITNFLSEWI